jgi:hypothetical protein
MLGIADTGILVFKKSEHLIDTNRDRLNDPNLSLLRVAFAEMMGKSLCYIAVFDNSVGLAVKVILVNH